MGIAIRGYSLATAEVFLTVWERDSQALGTEVPTVGNTVPRRLGTFCDLLKKFRICRSLYLIALCNASQLCKEQFHTALSLGGHVSRPDQCPVQEKGLIYFVLSFNYRNFAERIYRYYAVEKEKVALSSRAGAYRYGSEDNGSRKEGQTGSDTRPYQDAGAD